MDVTIARIPVVMSTSTRPRSRAGQRSRSSCAMRLPSASASASNRHTVSPLRPSDSRLGARIRRFPHEAKSDDTSAAHASMTCSQLSITSSMSRSAR
ncbi:MAG: hypothetical protein ACJ76T_02515 [Solirubrobacteraceae bacterium]